MKKICKNEIGQGLVEFALTLPLLLTILCGILDFGWIYSKKYEVEHAAFEGARYASIHASEISADDVAVYVQNILPASSVTTVVGGNDVTVTVSLDVQILTYVASTFYGPYYTAASTVTAALN